MISLRDVVTGFGVRDPLAEVWRRSLRGGGGGAAEITGVPPLRYIGDGRPLADYLISGNAVQDGTPSPDAPVDVVGCGAWDEAQQIYKLPLTVNTTEYPIYLGQVETTRRIKKLVLTGTAQCVVYDYNSRRGFKLPGLKGKYTRAQGICTHYPVYNGTSYNDCLWLGVNDSTLYFVGIGTIMGITEPEKFQAYLAQQYAAGAPVTVWYVLAEPETAIVNEPLMKIGDYADTVNFAQAGVTIPTVNGANVLDVPTEVPPSEITIKGGISSV